MERRRKLAISVVTILMMALSLLPQMTQTSYAASDTKITITCNGTTYTLTNSQWSSLYSSQKVTNYYSSSSKKDDEYEQYSGVLLSDVLSAVGISVSSLSSSEKMVFVGSDGYGANISHTVGSLLRTSLYAFDSNGNSTVVPTIISDRGRLIFGQSSKGEKNKTYWVSSVAKIIIGDSSSGGGDTDDDGGSTGGDTDDGDDTPTEYSGSGTEKNPYIISNAEELIGFSKDINNGRNADKYYKLSADIDLKYTDWTPAGTVSKPFEGTFDGNGKKITGLNVSSDGDYLGLFGYSKGTIQDLTISGRVANTNVSVTSEHGNRDFIGGVVGFNAGTIKDVDSNVVVSASGANNVGGIAGFNTSGVWQNVTSTDDDSGSTETIEGAVGLISQCSNAGTVTGRVKTGGIVGENAGTVEKCYNKGTIVNTRTFRGGGVGGISGRNGNNNIATETGIITDCYNAGTVVLDCYSEGSGEANKTGRWGGGVSGWVNNLSSVINTYVCGDLDVDNAYDDWAPLYARSDGGETMTNCYVLDSLPICPGITDELKKTDLSDADRTKYTNRIGTTKSEEYMKSAAFVSDLGSAFTTDTNNINNGYPVLKWQTKARSMTATDDIWQIKYLKTKTAKTSSLTLTWQAQSAADGYKVYMYKSGKYELIATLSGASTNSYTVKGLSAGTGYKFKVISTNTLETSATGSSEAYTYDGTYSDVLSAPTKPKTVSIKKPSTSKSHYVKVSWKKTTCTGYQVKIDTSKKFNSKNLKSSKVGSSKTLNEKFNKLKKGKVYYVKVRAYKKYGDTTVYGGYSKVRKIRCK